MRKRREKQKNKMKKKENLLSMNHFYVCFDLIACGFLRFRAKKIAMNNRYAMVRSQILKLGHWDWELNARPKLNVKLKPKSESYQRFIFYSNLFLDNCFLSR